MKTPETSQHTSIQKRTEAIQQHKRQPYKLSATLDKTCLKALHFRYKITVNWSTSQAALSEQIK